MSAGAKVFDAVSAAMRALVTQFPSGSPRPDWVTEFILAIGVPADLAKATGQMTADAEDAKRWRERPVAPPPVPGGRSLLQLVAAVQRALSIGLQPDGPNENDTLTEILALMDCAEQRAAEGQAQQDETDGALWRFLLRSADENSAECKLMQRLTEKYESAYKADASAAFAAHVVEGLALFKAEAH